VGSVGSKDATQQVTPLVVPIKLAQGGTYEIVIKLEIDTRE
jgi:hypothetical protein